MTDQPTPAEIAVHLGYIRSQLDAITTQLTPLATHEDRITRIETMISRLTTGLIALAVTVGGGIITYLITH